MNPLFKLLGIEKSFISFNYDVQKLGWSNACKKLIDDLKIDIVSDFTDLPKNEAVVIYSNHPTGLDPYLLTAAIGRNDSFFWGDIYQSKKGKNISKHIINVAPRPFWTIIFRPLSNWLGYIYMRLTTPAKSREETRNINIKTIDTTVGLLKARHQVIIFPSGGEFEFLPKKKGLSRVVDICRKKNIKVNIYKIDIKNFGEVLLFIHFIFRTKISATLSYTKIG
jgi:hypothetical protein